MCKFTLDEIPHLQLLHSMQVCDIVSLFASSSRWNVLVKSYVSLSLQYFCAVDHEPVAFKFIVKHCRQLRYIALEGYRPWKLSSIACLKNCTADLLYLVIEHIECSSRDGGMPLVVNWVNCSWRFLRVLHFSESCLLFARREF